MNRDQHRRWVPEQQPSSALRERNAALYHQDRARLDQMLATPKPTDLELIDLARLRIRYAADTPFTDIREDLQHLINAWGLCPDALYAATRDLWARNWRPRSWGDQDQQVGSGADVTAGN